MVLSSNRRFIIEDFSMNNYAQAAAEMKEMLISEYLKKNPGSKRNEITTKLVNGRVVIETVSNVICNCSPKNKKPAFSPKESSLLKQLAAGGDERYAACLEIYWMASWRKIYPVWRC